MDEEYLHLIKQKRRLLEKYECTTIEEVIQKLDELLRQKA